MDVPAEPVTNASLAPPPINYGAARRKLARIIKRSRLVPLCGEVAAALAELQKIFQGEVLAKFLASCAASSDPWEKMRLLMGEDLARSWWGTLDEVNAARKIIAGEYPDGREAAELVDLRLRFVDRFAKLYALRRAR